MNTTIITLSIVFGLLIVIFGGKWVYAKYEGWLYSHSPGSQGAIKSWISIGFWVIMTVVMSFGAYYGVLRPQVLIIPALAFIPLLLGIILAWWNYWKRRGQKLIESSIPANASADLIFTQALAEIGCQPNWNLDKTLSFSYQGENFRVEFGGRYARIWDPMWAGVRQDDPELPKIMKAINEANFQFGPTVVTSAPDQNGVIGLHSHRQIMLHPECPENTPYIKAVLDSFFETKEQVRGEFHRFKLEESQKIKNRRPVGFNVSKNEPTDE